MRIPLSSMAALVFLVAASAAWADTAPDTPAASTGEVAKLTLMQRVDEAHDNLCNRVLSASEQLDMFLSGSGDCTYQTGTYVKVRMEVKFEEGEAVSLHPSFSAHLTLPHAKERWHLFVDNTERRLLPGQDPEEADQNLNAGVRVSAKKVKFVDLSLDGGVKFRPEPQPFGILRLERAFALGKQWVLDFSQQGYWYQGDGFGETSRMDIERDVSPSLFFRSTTAATWSETTEGVEMEETWRLVKTFKSGRTLVLRTSVFAQKSSIFYMENYRGAITFRTRFLRRWLFFDITPQIEFPRDRDYSATPSIRFGLDAFFGDAI